MQIYTSNKLPNIDIITDLLRLVKATKMMSQ